MPDQHEIVLPRKESIMAVFCQQCGTALPLSTRFCSNCGAAIPAAPAIPRGPLVRPIAGRQIAGVCIGLSRAYGWDIALVRIFTVLGLFFSCGLVSIAYIACWIGIPEEPVALP
jgi:phage shock protein PspC (stress-responsive transcriptional regulator)